ncbi:ABC transporter ATP-binding protein [Streptomyces regalis]|uniref:Fatty acid ABC transporter ATP-binding/permease protein n=1 Tax=Streptomyces regalis TaxID=68262 RepID=A0A0X3VEB3_9ACTN|nr:ABC transporter ATP-binding protein [Streptomyces regalis]KUL42757.1 ABC transporter [Streptomyces regalis]
MPRVRSVIPGRQRWDVPDVCGRPVVARLIESLLSEHEDVVEAHANPVTGRVLVRHDPAVPPQRIAGLVREAVTLTRLYARSHAVRTTASAAAANRPDAGHPGEPADPTRPRKLSAALVRGGAVAVAALACGKYCMALLARPLVSLGLAGAATAVVVRKAWSRSDRARQRTKDGTTPRHHPLRTIIGRHKRQLGMATLLSVLAQLAEMALYALVPSTVLLLAKGESATLAALGVAGATAQLSVLVGAALVACLAMAALGYGAGVAWRKLGQTVEDDWRTRTYAHVQQLAPADLESERTSRVSTVLAEDISQLGNFVGGHLHETVQLATSLAALIPVYLLLAPQIAWVAFAPVPLVTWLSFRFHERAVADHIASGEHRARLSSGMADNLQAHTTIKAACTEEYESTRIAELSREYREANVSTDRSAAAQAQTLRLAGCSALVGTLLLGGRAVLKGELASAAFGPLIELPGIALVRLTRLGGITDQYQRTLAALERVQYLNDLPVESGTEGCRLPAQQVSGDIELRKVTFAYPGRPPALRDASLTIAPGRTTGIVGATGSGKTTIAKLLLRFRHLDEGHVLLDGTDVRTLALPDLRHAIGYVSQEPFLFDSTIAENIRYGTFDATDEQLVEAARTAGAHAFVDALPDGYDTLVGERGAALSGGQKQRIALARTILRDPPVVVLDEATSAVDNETEAAIQHALQAFGTNRTMIVIAHRLSTVRSADRIYVLGSGGLVAEYGTHDELVARDGTYATLWRLQAGLRVPA